MTTIRPIPDRPWEAAPEVSEAPWEAAPESPDVPALYGGGGATMAQGSPESFWEKAKRTLHDHIFGSAERAEAKGTGVGMQPTPAELGKTALAGAAAMAGGGAMGQVAAAPLRAGVALAEGYVGSEAGQKAGRVAERLGAPKGTAEVAGVAGGLLGGAGGTRKVAGAIRSRMMGPAAEAAAAEGAGAAVVPFPAPPAAPSGAGAAAEEIQAKILSLRKEHGLSGAQITSTLRQLYGIPPRDGQKMVDMVLAQFLKARP
jgi:nicotinate-nucleotide--dimethylbenzimidazole phosphoribosyltransferase